MILLLKNGDFQVSNRGNEFSVLKWKRRGKWKILQLQRDFNLHLENSEKCILLGFIETGGFIISTLKSVSRMRNKLLTFRELDCRQGTPSTLLQNIKQTTQR